MVIGKFGTKTFEVSSNKIYTFNDFSLSGELNTSTEEASKKKPATTIKGPGLLKISMEMQLLASAGIDVRSEIDAWTAIRDAGTAYPFILCGKAISLNSFLLTSCSASDCVILKAAGAPYITSASLKMDFDEYVPPGTKSSSKKKSSNSAKGVKSSTQVSNPYKVPTSTQKAAAKRTNVKMGLK